jgi:hypothetical protein
MDRHPAPVNYGNSVEDGEIDGFPDYQLRGKSHGKVRCSAAVMENCLLLLFLFAI